MKNKITEEITQVEPVAQVEPEVVEEKPKKLPWSKIIASLASVASKEQEAEKRLWANDIFTYQDLVSNPNAVIGILRDVYGADYGKLQVAAKEYEDATNGQ